MEFGQKKFFCQIDLFNFTSFLVCTFFNFLAHSGKKLASDNQKRVFKYSGTQIRSVLLGGPARCRFLLPKGRWKVRTPFIMQWRQPHAGAPWSELYCYVILLTPGQQQEMAAAAPAACGRSMGALFALALGFLKPNRGQTWSFGCAKIFGVPRV